MTAMGMSKVRQCFDDAAFSDFAGATFTNHPLQLFTQGLELRDASLDVFEMLLRDCIDRIATLVRLV